MYASLNLALATLDGLLKRGDYSDDASENYIPAIASVGAIAGLIITGCLFYCCLIRESEDATPARARASAAASGTVAAEAAVPLLAAARQQEQAAGARAPVGPTDAPGGINPPGQLYGDNAL